MSVEDNVNKSELKEMSDKELWQSKEYTEILNRLLRDMNISTPYISDYSYDSNEILDTLRMHDLPKDDPLFHKVMDLAGGVPHHYLVDLRRREIILKHLIPLLEKLPTYSRSPNKTLSKGEIQIDPEIPDDKITQLADFLMWAGVCTAQGKGTKLVNIDPLYMEALMAEGGNALSAALKDSNQTIDEMLKIFQHLRGEKLRKFLGTMLKRNKDVLLAIAKKQGIDVSVMKNVEPETETTRQSVKDVLKDNS